MAKCYKKIQGHICEKNRLDNSNMPKVTKTLVWTLKTTDGPTLNLEKLRFKK